ncbi:Hachiman antiphage defense system protein HamA [uncultured Winogradskyella sp.]|uniref:Hachiman antiphage defense system protein HamA n=1 Tax=uncultured Winogradskyella sp. TaxID=395353 RepID=UPI00261AC23E|nr:Hachiman antiphage defense system protein HamA [uncultured Winogradskyella sp.]
MAKQDTLIGKHPVAPNLFGKWLASTDHPDSDTQCHRSLTDLKTIDEDELLDLLSNELIKHHYNEDLLERLKKKYASLGFSEYAEQYRMLPNADKVRKGNLTEVILCEYVLGALDKPLVHTYRFRYSQNVDQSMKGDDVLLVDLDGEETKIYLGEAKFRKTPTKAVVEDISKSLSRDTKPLSFPFLSQRLFESETTRDIAEQIDSLIVETIKQGGGIIYAGLLLSNEKASDRVQDNLNSDNPNLLFISLGIENPTDLITNVFNRAQEKLNNPTAL